MLNIIFDVKYGCKLTIYNAFSGSKICRKLNYITHLSHTYIVRYNEAHKFGMFSLCRLPRAAMFKGITKASESCIPLLNFDEYNLLCNLAAYRFATINVMH